MWFLSYPIIRSCADRALSCKSAIPQAGALCESLGMSKSRANNKSRANYRHGSLEQASDGALPSDLFDYAEPSTHKLGRLSIHNQSEWTVTDNWPQIIPVTEVEIDIFEAWFGDVFDELFGTRR